MLESFKTSRDDFKLFKVTFMAWVEKFGLRDWNISFVWPDKESDNCRAAIRHASGTVRDAIVYLAAEWTEPVTPIRIKRTAIHELSHLLISDMEHLATSRFVTESEIDICREALARRFENAFYPSKH